MGADAVSKARNTLNDMPFAPISYLRDFWLISRAVVGPCDISSFAVVDALDQVLTRA